MGTIMPGRRTPSLLSRERNFGHALCPENSRRKLEQARSTANPEKRAALVAEAEKLATQQLPWIPTVQPDTVLLLGKALTGAVASSAYLFSPWADGLGGTG
jgi:ABC-type transport system substrate-binding protein